MKKIWQRTISFRNSDSPLTSKRVRIILSHPKDAEKLASAVRALRRDDTDNSTFTLSTAAKKAIEKEKQRISA